MPLSKGRVSLDRALSKLGYCSRVEAVVLIRAGEVRVHGVMECNPERMVNPDTAHIEVGGKKAIRNNTVMLLLHKPVGTVTTKRDPEGRKTVFDLLPAEYQSYHAVGRLDLHSSGLLLFTNDTQLSHYLTDPFNKVERVYVVSVKGEFASNFTQKLKDGVEENGEFLKADQVKILKQIGSENSLEIVLTAGKNREIRRLCMACGHKVKTLHRIRYGPYELLNLKLGESCLALDSQILL